MSPEPPAVPRGTDTAFVPPAAQMLLDDLRDHGMHATCTKTPQGFLVELRTDRVRATGVFRRRSSGWHHTTGALTIDGINCPTVRTVEELARVVADPSSHARGATSKAQPADNRQTAQKRRPKRRRG